MSTLIAARAFMGTTLAFHIFFALFGVGIPLLVSLAELIGIVRKDSDFTAMARRWTFALATLFVTGAISGTVVGVVFGVLLPPFMAIAGKVVGLPFFMETFMFFIESIFLGIYVYTWDRFRGRWTHWLTSVPIVLASAASAFLITTVNAFMTAPQGFRMMNGVVTDVHPWLAMFNAATPTRTTHSILSYYATTAFVFAAIAALALWRRRKEALASSYYPKMLAFAMGLALLFSVATVLSGDDSARYIAQNEPQKFAAAEEIMVTQADAPLRIGPLVIPEALSILVGGDPDVVVRGLQDFDPATWPPQRIHFYFDGMAVIGMLMLLVPLAYFAMEFLSVDVLRKRRVGARKFFLPFVMLTGALSIVAVELGWMLTEIGRQPWTIKGFLLTKDAFTSSQAVLAYAFVFPLFYIVLAIVTFWVLAHHYRRHAGHVADENLS